MASNDLKTMPFERELEDDDRMLDVIASWLKRDRSKNKGNKKTKKSNKNVRFVLKVKTYRKSMEKQFCAMGAKANFLTHVWHVVNDFFPSEDWGTGAIPYEGTNIVLLCILGPFPFCKIYI